MDYNLLIAGVGGQGILTIAQAVSRIALRNGLHVKQSEVHGMSQRGGAVQSHLRISDHPIHSDLIPVGQADMILAVEPLEALRYCEYLGDHSVIVANSVSFINVPDYPPLHNILDRIATLGDHVLVDAHKLARASGSTMAENMVMLGAAAQFLEFSFDEFDQLISEMFAAKSERIVEINRRALRMGRRAAELFREALQLGQPSCSAHKWLENIDAEQLALPDDHLNPESLRFELPPVSQERILNILQDAHEEGRSQLLEHEVYQIVDFAGAIAPPRHRFVPRNVTISENDLAGLAGDRVVLKIVSPDVVHKSEVHGIAFVPNSIDHVRHEAKRLLEEFSDRTDRIEGVLLIEYVEQSMRGWGSELFVGIRQTREFGPVIAAGIGGVDTEFLATNMQPGQAVAKASAIDCTADEFFEMFQDTAAYKILAGKVRGHERIVGDGDLIRCFRVFIAIAQRFCSRGDDGICLEELEVNPFAFRRKTMLPLDGRGRLGPPIRTLRPRPVEAATRILEPKSIAVVGVSGKGRNFGRIILKNIQDCGFPKDHLYVIKDTDAVDGVRCYPTIDALPERVDLLVAAISALQVPGLVDQVLANQSDHSGCNSVILIPGGLGEKEGTQATQGKLRAAIQKARAERHDVPVFLGGNCMGVRSRPGLYDTFFIPEDKLDPRRSATPKRAAIISQSGAFIITRMSNLEFLDPRFAISIGNQVDLTISDTLHALAGRNDIDAIGVYVEGFNNLDGLDFIRAVNRASDNGKTVIFYKAGKTTAGRSAAQGHTAAVAGDYDVCQSAVAAAGAIVTYTFKEFEQLLALATDLHGKSATGKRIAAVSNAGYEAVGIADTIHGTRYQVDMATLGEQTYHRLEKILAAHQLDQLVDPRNPMDLTPMASDAAYDACIVTLLDDEQVDALIVGCVPMTPRMLTTPKEIPQEDSIVRRLARIWRQASKPLVFVVDCAHPYDLLARAVRAEGIPVFRTADQAVRSLGRYLTHRVNRRGKSMPVRDVAFDAANATLIQRAVATEAES
ncbi:MAG: indolepyruvate oxidoreductase subunit beta [Planctomycetota bacterium]|jgi:indolepyruvate ferredoxin oxidoreductase beta subunit